jgi:hypothetical protein
MMKLTRFTAFCVLTLVGVMAPGFAQHLEESQLPGYDASAAVPLPLDAAGAVYGNPDSQCTPIVAHPSANNGGSSGWAIFFDFEAIGGNDLFVTELSTASTAAANAGFTVEVFTRAGSGLGGPVNAGPGSSPAGWTSLGMAPATQGPVASQISLRIDIPDIFVPGGEVVGVALRFTGAGPRYFGTGTPPYSVFSDAELELTTGDSRSAPFTPTGSFFTSRALAGDVCYELAPPACGPGSIATLFGSNNNGSPGGAVYFNLNVANANGITVESIDCNTTTTAGTAVTLDVFVTPGGFNGKETNMGLWNLVSTGAGVTAANNTPTSIDVADFNLAQGLWGIAYRANGFTNAYTNGNGANQNHFSADCDISAGKASNVPFTAPLFTPRVVNTRIHYCAAQGTGTNYCRTTRTNRGCLPHTSSSGTASATGGPGSFTVACDNLPSKKNGFLLLSTQGAQATPFGGGTLCLQLPIFRLQIQNSGGTGICDGAFKDDFGAVISANPGVFPPGEEVFCQYLFRESSLPMGVGLSDGHRFTIAP